MLPKVTVPTDNIYKFYALFGLVLLIFSLSSLIYTNQSRNDAIFKIIIEQETLNAVIQPNTTQQVTSAVLARKLEIIKSDKWFYLISISILACIAGYLIYYGFTKWHNKIQPLQDELIELSIKKLKKELRVSLPNKSLKQDK